MIDNSAVDVNRDLKRHRVWECKFNKVHFIQDGPYGFWFVHLDKGASPKELRGMFTSFDQAVKAVTNFYLIPKNEEVKRKIN